MDQRGKHPSKADFRARANEMSAEPRSICLSPDRDIDLMRRYKALKGDLSDGREGDSAVTKQPLTLAEIQGSIAKRHSTDLANAQRNWIENWAARTTVDEPSEEDEQKKWISQLQFAKITNRREDSHRRAEPGSGSSERRSSLISSKSSPSSSPRKASRNVVVKSTTLTPSAPTFGYCDVPHISVSSFPVTATSVKEDSKKCKQIVTDSGKTIKMLKLEEPPKYEKKVTRRSPRKMKAIIDEDSSANQGRWRKKNDSSKSSRKHSFSPEKSNKSDSKDLVNCVSTLSPKAVEKYKLTFNKQCSSLGNCTDTRRKSGQPKDERSALKKLKRCTSLPGGLNDEPTDNQSTSNKHSKNYDVSEARNFIKQKQKEREERLAAEKRRKTIEAEERTKKMQHLRDTQRKIMQQIKKRTVNKCKSPSVILKESEPPNWVGPLESTTPSVLDTSLDFAKPKPKSQALSSAATGTITFKERKKPSTSVVDSGLLSNASKENQSEGPNVPFVASTQTEEVVCEAIQPIKTCYKNLEVTDNSFLGNEQTSNYALLVESSTQVPDLDKCLCSQSEIGSESCSRSPSKALKHPRDYGVIKENMGSMNSINTAAYPSEFDKFLADYMPTPQKARRLDIKLDTPSWLEELKKKPDKFNLINTLDMAMRKQKSTPYMKEKTADLRKEAYGDKVSKLDELNTVTRQAQQCGSHIRVNHNSELPSSSNSITSDGMFLNPPPSRLIDGRLSSSTATFNTAHSFEPFSRKYPTQIDRNRVDETNKLEHMLPNRDVRSSDLDFLFPLTNSKVLQGRPEDIKRVDCEVDVDSTLNANEKDELYVLGEKVVEPKGQITLRKPLKRRMLKMLDESPNNKTYNFTPVSRLPSDLVKIKRGSEELKENHPVSASNSDRIQSCSTSFSSTKEGSYLISRLDSKSSKENLFKPPYDSSYANFVKNVQRSSQNVHSENSSDSLSEIVKVSRTVSRGSTVISEEVSEVQNTVSYSKDSLKFNSSTIHNIIKNEIEQLDRVDESLSSFLNAGKTVGHLRLTAPIITKSESLDQISQDAITVRPKTPPAPIGEIDTTISALPRSLSHSRDSSNSSLDASLAVLNGVDVSKASLEMFDNLIKDEKLRSEQHMTSLKMRMKSVCNRTKRDLELIEVQRKSLIESGLEEEARELKRKQRGHIMKMNEEIEELQRLRTMENKACHERCMLLKQQEQLIRLLLHQENKHVNVRGTRGSMKSLHSSQLDETVRHLGNDRNSDIIDRKKREYREKEEALKERKKNIEAIVAWRKRLDAEEKNVCEMEKLIAEPNVSTVTPQRGVERGTSPFNLVKETIDRELKCPLELPQGPVSATSQSESEHQNKDYYSDSFEHSSALSESNIGTNQLTHGSSLLNKAMKMPILKAPLSPRVTIIKRRHSSGSDESMLLSQNDTLSEQSDVEVRVSALEQQLKHRKSELAKLKREYQKNQKERLRTTEKNLIYQIQLYDSFIEQVKTEIKEFESVDVKVTKPQIKQPKFHDKRQSDKFPGSAKTKEVLDSVSESKDNDRPHILDDSSALDGSVMYFNKEFVRKTDDSSKDKTSESLGEVSEKLEVQSSCHGLEQDNTASDVLTNEVKSTIDICSVMTDPELKDAMEKVKLKAMEPSRDSESLISDKDFSIEEIIERAEQSKVDSLEEIPMESNLATQASVTDLMCESNQLSVVDEIGENFLSNSCVSTHKYPELEFGDVSAKEESLTIASGEVLSEECIVTESAAHDENEKNISESIDQPQSSIYSHVGTRNGSELSAMVTIKTESINDRPFTIAPSLNKHVTERDDLESSTSNSQKIQIVDQVSPTENKISSIPSSSPFDFDVGSLPLLKFSPEKSTSQRQESKADSKTKNSDISSERISTRGDSSVIISAQALPENPSDSLQSVSEGVDVIEVESPSVSQVPSTLASAVQTISQENSSNDKSGLTSKCVRKRLDMKSDSSVKTASVDDEAEKEEMLSLEYEPTMKVEGGTGSISEISGSNDGESKKDNSEVISGSETLGLTDLLPVSNVESGELLEEVEEEGEELFESVSGQGDDHCSGRSNSLLDKFDFKVDFPSEPQSTQVNLENVIVKDHLNQTEAGDNPAIQSQIISGDKKELGQGDELCRDLDAHSMDADSLEDPLIDDFNATFDVGELKQYLETSSDQDAADLSPLKSSNNLTVMQLLQNSFEMGDNLWEENLADMKKSSEETPLLTALQRERQQNFNVDSISQMIYDSFVENATHTALQAYSKKKELAYSEIETAIANDMDTELLKVGDNEKFWLGKQAAHEAERLRRHQLQIEREIEQLEQAQEVVPYYYVREIPNKPPPPYTPPKPALPSKEEIVSRVLQGGEILWDIEMNGGDLSNVSMPPTFLSQLQDEPYKMFLFDLAKELYLEVKPRPPEPTLSWVIAERPGKPRPPIRTKEDLLKNLEREVKLTFGYEPRILRESLITKWTRKRRDHVNEIIVRELQESQAEWRDFTVEENIIKNQIADDLIAEAIDNAVAGLSFAFTRKFDPAKIERS